MLQSGDVIYIYCVFIKPPDYKYAVCVCPKSTLFFFINSDSRRISPDAQLLIKKSDLPRLSYDSYISTAKLLFFSMEKVNAAEKRGRLPVSVKQQIIEVVKNHNYLPARHERLVFDNFSEPPVHTP